MALFSASEIDDLSAGAFRDNLSSARSGDVQVSSGPSVPLAMTSSSVPRIVSDVRHSHPSPTPTIPVAPCPLVSSSVPSSLPFPH